MKKTELLLPVGNYQMCLAAIHNGADAIYVGMPEFNARGRSHDHSWDELEEIIKTCHLYSVKVHLAFNILIFENELVDALSVLDKAVALSPDALIVQDLGLISLIRKRYPQLEVHGSTQMSISNHEAISLLDDLNIQRFVLARENTLEDIKTIKENTSKEIEVFVHGALCVAYSGQCFTSESLGGRSANRGQCAQSCRFPYDIYVDNKKRDLKNKKYLVSPQDLCGIDDVPELVKVGVDSFKVEGRLKSSEFVAECAKQYQAMIQGNLKNSSIAKTNLAVTYSRGHYSGWLHGVAHQELVRGDYKENRGAFLGKITHINKKEVSIEHDRNIQLENGDGLLFVNPLRGDEEESGAKIHQVSPIKNGTRFQLDPKFNLQQIRPEYDVYLTRKEEIIKQAQKTISDRSLKKRLPIYVEVSGQMNQPLKLKVKHEMIEFELYSESLLDKALNISLDRDSVFKELSGLSQTAYFIDDISYSLEDALYLHRRNLKSLKQEMVARLNDIKVNKKPLEPKIIELNRERNSVLGHPYLNIVIRKIEQLSTLVDYLKENPQYLKFLGHVVLDYEFGKDYFPSCQILREQKIKAVIATTRVLKPGEYHNFKLIDRCSPDGLLIRNLGALQYFQDSKYELFGDFSLNCANSHTFDYLISKKLKTVCLSYDLNIEQIETMMKNIDLAKSEVVIHQYMPEFHMEHCVFAAFLSHGNSFRDCGKPCEKHEVHLKDMYGNRHEIKADQECRNTMFNAKAVSTVEFFYRWLKQGVGSFRFECLHETASELTDKIDPYFKLLNEELVVSDVLDRLNQAETYGLGLGHMALKDNYKSRKK